MPTLVRYDREEEGRIETPGPELHEPYGYGAGIGIIVDNRAVPEDGMMDPSTRPSVVGTADTCSSVITLRYVRVASILRRYTFFGPLAKNSAGRRSYCIPSWHKFCEACCGLVPLGSGPHCLTTSLLFYCPANSQHYFCGPHPFFAILRIVCEKHFVYLQLSGIGLNPSDRCT